MMFLIATLASSATVLLLLVVFLSDARDATREGEAMRACYLGEPLKTILKEGSSDE